VTITYPLALPTVRGPARIDFHMNDAIGMSQSPFSAEQEIFENPAKFWTAEVTLGTMNRAEGETWIAWLAALFGRKGTFLMGDPLGAAPRGVGTGTPKVNGNQAAFAVSLATKGWTPTTTGILLAGDWLQLGSGASTHLHKNLTDANSDGSGNATLDIWPPLRAAVLDNDAIVVSAAKGLFRLATNERVWTLEDVRVSGISFPALEVL